MEAPLISVVLPVYNAGNLLKGMLQALAVQSLNDFEVLCINDGSTDCSRDILEKFAENDSRFKVINQTNKGEAAARNTGLEKAAGKYVYFADNDDYLHPQTLEILYKVLVESGLPGAVCGYQMSQEVMEPITPDINCENLTYRVIDKPLQSFIENSKLFATAPWCKLYERSLIGETRFVEGMHFDDAPFNVFMLYKQEKIAFIDIPLYFWYQNPQSVSHKKMTVAKIASYKKLIFSIDDFLISCGDMEMLDLVRSRYFPVQVNIIMGMVKKAVECSKEEKSLFKQELRDMLQSLLKRKVISYKDFKWRKKLEIGRLLFFK